MNFIKRYINYNITDFSIVEKTYFMVNVGMMETINLIINIVVAIVSVVILRLGIFEIILVMFSLDMLMGFVEWGVVKVCEKRHGNEDLVYREKYLDKLVDIREKIKKGEKDFAYSIDYKDDCKQGYIALQKISDIIFDYEYKSKYIIKDNRCEKEKVNVQRKTTSYYEIVEELEVMIKEKGIGKFTKGVIINSKNLIGEVGKTSGNSRVLDKVIGVYLVELLEIATKVKQADREVYAEKMLELVKKYNEHTLTEIERVKTTNRNNLENSINTLKEELEGERRYE